MFFAITANGEDFACLNRLEIAKNSTQMRCIFCTSKEIILPNDTSDSSSESEDSKEGISPTTRKVVSKSPHRSVGIIACSWLQDKAIEYESQLEKRFVQRALLFPYIKYIQHQPFKLKYQLDEKLLEYTPDYLVTLTNGMRLIIEVKPEPFVKKNIPLFDKASQIFLDKDFYFFVVTDKNLGSKTKQFNTGLLLRYARGNIRDEDKQRVLTLMNDLEKPTIETLANSAGLNLQNIYLLIARHVITTNTDLDANPETIVNHLSQGDQNAFIFFCNWIDTTPWGAVA